MAKRKLNEKNTRLRERRELMKKLFIEWEEKYKDDKKLDDYFYEELRKFNLVSIDYPK